MAAAARADRSDINPDALSEAELRQLHALLADQAEGEPLEDFIRRVTPHHPPPPHVLPIIRCFERARRRWLDGGEPLRVCISMPPRHAKSETLFNGIAWWLTHVPADTHAYLSYSIEQARSQSRKIRRRAVDGGVALDTDMSNLSEWRTTSGGGVFASGVDGPLTGKGVTGLVVIDDPFKGRKDADSPTIRQTVWDWFTGTVMSRLEDASVMVVHTRWHGDDLIGRLSKEEGWEIINLPALAEENDPLGRELGEPLWPEARPLEMLLEQKKLDAFNFDALYQGRPRPRGAKVFQEPHYYPAHAFDATGCRIILFADPAASKRTTANHSAVLALYVKGYGVEMRGWVREVYREQQTIPQFVRDLRAFQLRHGSAVVNVEAVAGFKAVPQMLREIDENVQVSEVVPLGDKFQRAQPAASAWNDGRILVPDKAPWLEAFLAELRSFTGVNDAADDQVDCLSGAWNEADKGVTFKPAGFPLLPRRR